MSFSSQIYVASHKRAPQHNLQGVNARHTHLIANSNICMDHRQGLITLFFFFCDRRLHLCVQVVRMTQREYTNYIFFIGIFVSTHKASLFKTRATLSDSAVRWDRAAAKQFMDRQ